MVRRAGIAGLSHRAVAAEADVPLGSTTYHFATLDELLVVVLRQSGDGFCRVVAGHEGLTDPRGELAGELAAALGERLAPDRAGAELEYELYLAALRPPPCARWPPNGRTASPRCWPPAPIRSPPAPWSR
ncbi:hypothetical protein ACE1SV_46800 [Streptomyces sennicomposti]